MTSDPGRAAFETAADVSSITMDRFDTYAAMLRKWNVTINLVSPNTLPDLWSRHFLDSLGVWLAAGGAGGSWLDLGTGGGFPGLAVALLAAEKAPDLRMTCVEVDMRKATFLRNVSRETGVPIAMHTKRVEMLPPQGADIVSARALTSLSGLLEHADRHLKAGGTALFPKGAKHDEEIEAALDSWRFSLEKHPSLTEPTSAILKIRDIARV